jgi:hypothetical protein
MTGGVYAPKATVSMGGGAGGTGGNLTIQFISWGCLSGLLRWPQHVVVRESRALSTPWA